MDTDAMPRRFGREAVWVVAMTMLGAGVRLKGLGTLGLDHFDEGIYAQAAARALADGGLRAIDPGLIPYAPPGYPALVGLAYRLLGPSGTAAILVSILAGVLTIPVLAWLSRIAFGPGAGAATAALVALAGPHVVFSRTGLTDATFLLAWSAALLAAAHFLERPDPWRAIRLGLAVGLAQLVKYNGAMAGLIVVAAVLLGAIRPGDARRSVPTTLVVGLLAAFVSVVVYLPWFLFVERTTGYAGLMTHHRSYVDGPSAWWPNWGQQMAQADAMAGLLADGLTWAGLAAGLAWIGAAIGQGRSPRSWGRLRHLGPPTVLLVVILCLWSPPNLMWWAALAWSPLLVRDARPSARLVGAWFLVMALVTPLYHPYARLWLPTLAASWVAGGGLITSLLAWFRSLGGDGGQAAERESTRGRAVAPAALAGVVLALIGPMLRPAPVVRFPELLARSDGIRTLADALTPEPGAPRGTTHLYARPPLRFYLAARSAGPIAVHGDLDSLRSAAPRPGDRAVIDAAQGVSASQVEAMEQGGGWRLVEVVDVPASIPTLLDVRPECVSDPSARHLGRSPTSPEAPPDPDGRAGSSRFWILAPP